eukprot:5909656-Amphidinium_carterae.2
MTCTPHWKRLNLEHVHHKIIPVNYQITLRARPTSMSMSVICNDVTATSASMDRSGFVDLFQQGRKRRTLSSWLRVVLGLPHKSAASGMVAVGHAQVAKLHSVRCCTCTEAMM